MSDAAINALAFIGGTYIFLIAWGEVWEWLQPEDSTQSGKKEDVPME